MVIYSKFKVNKSKAYDWLITERLIGQKENSPISPWYHVDYDEMRYINEIFLSDKDKDLILFARRQDCDDMAFLKIVDNNISGVYLVEGWVGNKYEIIEKYKSLWDWLKSVIDDLAEIVE